MSCFTSTVALEVKVEQSPTPKAEQSRVQTPKVGWSRVQLKGRAEFGLVRVRDGASPDKTSIANSKETAIIDNSRDMSTIKIYTDKSSCKGGVGATAVLFINGTQRRVLQYYLGTDKTHTLYKAEIVGMILAATMLQEYGFLDGVAIGIDNQGVIKAISS